MQMQLKQAHIEAAIRDFVTKAGIQFPIDEISFTAGRGKDGLTATIDLEDPFATLLDKASGSEPEAPATEATRTMEARGNENIMPSTSKKKSEVKAKEDTSEPEDRVDPPAKQAPPFSDEEEEEGTDSSKASGSSLFG